MPVSLFDRLPDDVRILSLRDRKGGLHLPLDYFLTGINDPLQQALPAQAILAATVAESLEVVLRRHAAGLLQNSELFPPPTHQRLAKKIDLDQIRPLLSLYGEFSRYLHSSQFVTTRETNGADAGPGLWDERRTHLSELRWRIAQLVPDDAEARDRFIDEWFPEEVAETIPRFARGWSVPDLESVPLPALRGAVRNLFAIRLIGERAVLDLPVAARARVQAARVMANAATVANAVDRVSVSKFQIHHVSRDGGSPLYETLQDWWLGDFAIPGPLPAGLAELPIQRISQLREVFGNYDHLFVRVSGKDDRDGDADATPDSSTPSEGIRPRHLVTA